MRLVFGKPQNFPGRLALILVLTGTAGIARLHPVARAAPAAQELPAAEAVLDKFVEVTGGKAAYEKLHNEVAQGTVTVVGMSLSGTIITRAAAPDKSYSGIDMAGLGLMEEGTNGDVAWERSALQGPRIKTGEERSTALRDAAFNAPVRWRELYAKAELAGVEDVEGRPSYKVVLTPSEGRPVTQYYDRENGLLVKMTMVAASPMGDVPVEVLLSDYKEASGVRVPHYLRQKVISQEIHIQLKSVQYNTDLSDSAFNLPEDVRALVAKAKPGKG